ncbi:hypothetical protein BCV72DRAFT_326469 [Rhizopus microsporus var. microsporus]|uniref:Tc1-like transposase DDE domain-containing protein n=1 Tax=Rhizopus microsporus var. microsporus TaxID=86635 RepID=A0A1X0QLS6_RHIZD|nr:hypothetical protein BCV72DRAFT_326469 [Rhizopus microsporus var. microsporus]
MPRILSTENNKAKKRSYRNIPVNIRQLIIEQVALEGAIIQSEAARRYGQHTSTRKLLAKFPDLAEKGISTSGLWKLLTDRIGFTLKRTKPVVERRNTPVTIQQRYEYVTERFNERGISYKANCIFVDEYGFNSNLIRGQDYSTSIVVNAAKRTENLSILAGISYKGVEDASVKLVKGGTTETIFKDFVAGIMKKLDQTNAGAHFFVMDNASIYKTPEVRYLFKYSNHHMCLLPPYSTFLDPIEERFSKLKSLVRRKPHLRDTRKLIEHIQESTYKICEENCQDWVEHSIEFFKDCMNKKEIY